MSPNHSWGEVKRPGELALPTKGDVQSVETFSIPTWGSPPWPCPIVPEAAFLGLASNPSPASGGV